MALVKIYTKEGIKKAPSVLPIKAAKIIIRKLVAKTCG